MYINFIISTSNMQTSNWIIYLLVFNPHDASDSEVFIPVSSCSELQAVRIWICMMVAHSCCGASAMIRRHRTVATGKDAGLLTPSWPANRCEKNMSSDIWFSPKTACKEYWTYVSINIKYILMHIYGIWNPRCSNIVHLDLALLSWLRQKCVGSLRGLCISKHRIIRMLSTSLSLSIAVSMSPAGGWSYLPYLPLMSVFLSDFMCLADA